MCLSVALLTALFVFVKGLSPAELLLYEAIPYYEVRESYAEALFNPGKSNYVIHVSEEPIVQAEPEADVVLQDSESDPADGDIIGIFNVQYQPDDKQAVYAAEPEASPEPAKKAYDLEQLRDIDFLASKFYTVDTRTRLTAADFNVDKFITADLKIKKITQSPQIIIFHTHSSEGFSNSSPGNLYDGVFGLGEKLSDILLEKYGIRSIHCTQRFDVVDGKTQIMGAYERMEPVLKQMIADNPSVEIAIDIHRDGVPENMRLVTTLDGKPTAQIMFFNGLSKLYQNGSLTSLSWIPNPNLPTNLAFSFNMQLSAMSLYPGFTRKPYLNAYRYSLGMLPKSLLVEVGAQTNTMEEAFNAIEPLADILADVVLDLNTR